GNGRPVDRRARIAWRRGEAVREHLGGHEEVLRGIERAPGANKEIVAVMVRPVPRRDQNRVVALRVERAERRIRDLCAGKDDAALETEVAEREQATMDV